MHHQNSKLLSSKSEQHVAVKRKKKRDLPFKTGMAEATRRSTLKGQERTIRYIGPTRNFDKQSYLSSPGRQVSVEMGVRGQWGEMRL